MREIGDPAIANMLVKKDACIFCFYSVVPRLGFGAWFRANNKYDLFDIDCSMVIRETA